MIQTTFERREVKYLLTSRQYEDLVCEMKQHMVSDAWGDSCVRNVYYDTPSHLLARRSAEHPQYKEKLRIRSYSRASDTDDVFVEIKKKFDGIVYKRRVVLPYYTARLLCDGFDCDDTQIGREIHTFTQRYARLYPAMFVAYDRCAYYGSDDDTFRMTFDRNIRCRWDDVTLCGDDSGVSLISPDSVLLEVKCAGAMPRWLSAFLCEHGIYKTSFSKYCKAVAVQSVVDPCVFEEPECVHSSSVLTFDLNLSEPFGLVAALA